MHSWIRKLWMQIIPKRALCSREFWCMFPGLSSFGCVSIYYSYLYSCSVSAGFWCKKFWSSCQIVLELVNSLGFLGFVGVLGLGSMFYFPFSLSQSICMLWFHIFLVLKICFWGFSTGKSPYCLKRCDRDCIA